MTSFVQKFWPIISIVLLLALVVSSFFFPEISSWISVVLLISSLGMAFFFIIRKHISPYKKGQTTRTRFTRNVLLDVLGLLLAIAGASYFGGIAGMWAGEKNWPLDWPAGRDGGWLYLCLGSDVSLEGVYKRRDRINSHTRKPNFVE